MFCLATFSIDGIPSIFNSVVATYQILHKKFFSTALSVPGRSGVNNGISTLYKEH